jgi:hypothetical protein
MVQVKFFWVYDDLKPQYAFWETSGLKWKLNWEQQTFGNVLNYNDF